MTEETDIPCADCDGTLVERTIRPGELPVETTYQGRVDVAECSRCDARYYPERALARLLGGTSEPHAPTCFRGGEFDG